MADAKNIPAAFLGNIVENVLQHSSVTTIIYKPVQPLSTIKRHSIVIPDQAETANQNQLYTNIIEGGCKDFAPA